MAIGKVGSFATDKPVQDTVGDAMRYTEQMGFKYREEAEKKKEKEDAIKKANEAIPELKAKTTPYSNRNAFIYDTLDKLKTGMAEKQRLASSGKISQQESNLFKQNAMQTIDLLNQSSERITAQNANMAKLISEGKVADGFEKDALALGGAVDKNQMYPEVNPDGTLNVTVYDIDESGKKRVLDSGGLDKIGEVAYTPIRNVKFEDYLKTFRDTHPIDFEEKFVGNTKVGTKELTPRLASSINDYADALLADKDALAVAYKNATGNIKRDITDAKDIQAAKDYVIDYIKGSYNKELMVDEATQRSELARQKAKDKKEEVVAQIEVVETPPVYAENGVVPMEGYKTVSVVGGQPIQQISAFDKSGNPITMDTAFLNSYTVTKNPTTGERAIAAEITYPDYKSAGYTKEEKLDIQSKLKSAKNQEEADLILSKATKPISYKTKVAYLTVKDASKYLKVGNFKSVNELKDKARVFEEEQPKESNIPTYSKADLKANGWSDSQIQQAVKLGKIKVN